MDLELPFGKSMPPWGIYAESAGAPALDFGQDLIDHAVVRHHLAEGGVEALEQLPDVFVIASQERHAHALAHGRERGATDRRDLADGDLTACFIQKCLQVCEGCA